MIKSFICSIICPSGIIGGGLYISDTEIVYKTNKLTVDRKYKNLVIYKNQICEISWKWIIFPIATIRSINGEKYSFIIFNKKGFEKCL